MPFRPEIADPDEDAAFEAELMRAMTAPVGPPCCELSEKGVLHMHPPRRPGGTAGILMIPETLPCIGGPEHPDTLEHIMECERCGFEFDPIAHRWLCPECKHKANCCEGAPL